MRAERFDVAVIGCGLTGAAAARELTSRDHSVLLLEQYSVGHERGSSHGSSRIYRRGYADAAYVALMGRADDEWQRLEDEAGVVLRTPTGGLDAGPDRAHQVHDALTAHGVEATLLSPAEVAERWPGIALDDLACFHPQAGHLNPDLTVTTLVGLATAHGADVREETALTRLEPVADGVVVHTESASHLVGTVVVAAGAWLPELLGGLGVDPPLPALSVRQVEVFHHRHRDPASVWPTLMHSSHRHRDGFELYALSSGSDGGAAPAYKIGQYDTNCVTTASSRDGLVNERTRKVMRGFVERHLPGLEPEPIAEKSCLFMMTGDGDFVLDRAAAGGGRVVIASPCSGHGAKFAPLLGVLVADLVEGGRPHPRFAFRSSPLVRASHA